MGWEWGWGGGRLGVSSWLGVLGTPSCLGVWLWSLTHFYPGGHVGPWLDIFLPSCSSAESLY